MCLPYWDSEIDVEASAWGASRRVSSQSANKLHGKLLEELSENTLALGSEFLYLSGKNFGEAGSMLWDEPFTRRSFSGEPFFMLVLGCSPAVERTAANLLERFDGVKAGVTDCTFWNRGVPVVRCRVTAFVAVTLVFDELDFLTVLNKELKECKEKDLLIPYYAGRLGFVRAPLLHDTDMLTYINIIDKLDSFQLDATRSVVGPAVSVPMPDFCAAHSPSVMEVADAGIVFLNSFNKRCN